MVLVVKAISVKLFWDFMLRFKLERISHHAQAVDTRQLSTDYFQRAF